MNIEVFEITCTLLNQGTSLLTIVFLCLSECALPQERKGRFRAWLREPAAYACRLNGSVHFQEKKRSMKIYLGIKIETQQHKDKRSKY